VGLRLLPKHSQGSEHIRSQRRILPDRRPCYKGWGLLIGKWDFVTVVSVGSELRQSVKIRDMEAFVIGGNGGKL
jgi:hypothetical protein